MLCLSSKEKMRKIFIFWICKLSGKYLYVDIDNVGRVSCDRMNDRSSILVEWWFYYVTKVNVNWPLKKLL